VPENLALACWHCNLKKGPNLSGIDPESGRVSLLFHPRTDEWPRHFVPMIGAAAPFGIAIHGLTAKGRATTRVLGMNDEMRQLVRYELWAEGRYEVTTG
jgi:hypothetical protein